MDDPIEELQGILGELRQVSAISTSPSGCVISIDVSVPRAYPRDLLHRSVAAVAAVVERVVETGQDVELESSGGWLAVRLLKEG